MHKKDYGKKKISAGVHILTVIFDALLQHVTVVVGEPIDFKDTVKEMKERKASQVDIRESMLGLRLNSVSSKCARGKSSIARKPEVHPKIFKWWKRLKNVTNLIFVR